jgi:hypothetical protein
MQLKGRRFPAIGRRKNAPVPTRQPLIVQAGAGRNIISLVILIVPSQHLAKQAGKFVKHVLPAAVKPVHSLWHEVLGFVFFAFAAGGAWKVARHAATMGPVQLTLVIPLIIVTAGYGISSFLKARRISRS